MLKNSLPLRLVFISIVFSLIASCDKRKKELAKEIIQSYAQAVKEDDKDMLIKIFPDIIYFDEYYKVDKIIINDLETNGDKTMALCSLFYETKLGKDHATELSFLVNTKDSTIEDAKGFLTRKDRNDIRSHAFFKIFPDLLPKEDEMDVTFVKNRSIAWYRTNGFIYYAQKAIDARSQVSIDVSQKAYYRYSIPYFSNHKIDISIENKSDFDCKYEYVDDNIFYFEKATFPAIIEITEDAIGSKRLFIVKAGETLKQTQEIREETMYSINQNEIKIRPYFKDTEEAINVVKKYYDSFTIDSILKGEKNYWEETYNYAIKTN